MGCQPGCSECHAKCGHAAAAFGLCCGEASHFKPTNNQKEFRTYQNFGGLIDVGMRHNPWRAPGHAPVEDPCGVITGNQPREYVVGAPDAGTKGSDLPETPREERPSWPAGSHQEVSWNIYANHGGGYAYRLCKKADGEKLTEECFQQNHLQFVADHSWIQYGEDKANRTAINGTRLVEGTKPAGAHWKKNPIPACWGDVGGAANPLWLPLLDDCSKAQFDPPLAGVVATHHKWAPLPGLYGFGVGSVGAVLMNEQFDFWTDRFNFNIVDEVKIPADLSPGDYALSWRWDAEQTPQIWSNCADITITAPAMVV